MRRALFFSALAGLAAAAPCAFAACSSTATIGPTPLDAGDAGDAAADAAPDGPVPKGARVLGLTIDFGETGASLLGEIGATLDAGARETNMTATWDEIEKPFDGGTGEGGVTAIFGAQFHAVDDLLDGTKIGAALAVDAVDPSGPRLPVDLAGDALDDPAVMTRYEAIVDYVKAQTPDLAVSAFLVGDSADVAFGSDPAKVAALAAFVTHASAYAKTKWPNVLVGFTVTADGLVADSAALAPALAASDAVFVRWLEVDASAHAKPAAGAGADLDAIVAAAPADRPVIFHEVGYPTAAAAGADEAAQAAFVSQAFAAWDRHADRVPRFTFLYLDDPAASTVSARAGVEGRSDPAFSAMLGSTGLRHGVVPKAGLAALATEAHARGY